MRRQAKIVEQPIPRLSQASDINENSPIEDPVEYFSKLLWVMTTHVSELSLENVDKLEATFLDCEDHFNDIKAFDEVYKLISIKLRDAIKQGLSDELSMAEIVLSLIQDKLRESAPTLLFGGPLDEAEEDDELLGKFKNLPLKTKLKYAALGGLIALSLGIAGNSDSEFEKTHYSSPKEYYEDFYKDAFEKNPELLKEIEAEEDTFHKEREGKMPEPEGEQTVNRLSDLNQKTTNFQISDAGIQHLKDIEQLRLKPYFPTQREAQKYAGRKDNLGKTIGYGHVITENDKDLLNIQEITEQQADEIFKKDCLERGETLKRNIALLPDHLQDPNLYSQGFVDGMCSFIFNIGNRNFLNNSKTWNIWKNCRIDEKTGKIRDDDYDWLCHTIKNDFVTDTGHIARRKAEADLLSHKVN